MINQEENQNPEKPVESEVKKPQLEQILKGAEILKGCLENKTFELYQKSILDGKKPFINADSARKGVLMNKQIYSALQAIHNLIRSAVESGRMKVEIKVKQNHDSFAAAFAYFQQELGYDVLNNTAKKTKEQKSKGQNPPEAELHEFYEISWKFKKQTNA